MCVSERDVYAESGASGMPGVSVTVAVRAVCLIEAQKPLLLSGCPAHSVPAEQQLRYKTVWYIICNWGY